MAYGQNFRFFCLRRWITSYAVFNEYNILKQIIVTRINNFLEIKFFFLKVHLSLNLES